MFMKEIAEKKASDYRTHVAQRKESNHKLEEIKKDFHLRALIMSLAK